MADTGQSSTRRRRAGWIIIAVLVCVLAVGEIAASLPERVTFPDQACTARSPLPHLPGHRIQVHC